MTKLDKQAIIDNLAIVLEEKMRYYTECVKRDEIFEVRKAVREQIKQIEKQIAELRSSDGQQS